jgi:DNA (cytosine-5)-methyltransferase 1
MFKVLDLFSGIGGFSLGLEATGAFRTIAFCEQDRFCQAVLRKHWPGIPIHPDVKTFDFQGECDVITGGYPCQPFSVAGKQKGFEDDRHLWPAMFEIVAQKKPSYVICENVYGHISMGVDTVLLDLASENYTCLPFVAGACAVNAPHRRQRVFIIARKNVANPDHTRDRASEHATVQDGQKIDQGQKEQPQSQLGRLGQNVADTSSAGLKQGHEKMAGKPSKQSDRRSLQSRKIPNANSKGLEGRLHNKNFDAERRAIAVEQQFGKCGNEWFGNREIQGSTQQCLGLPPDGLPRWVAGTWERGVPRVVEAEEGRKMKLKALGNAVVPQVVEQIGLAIIEAEQQ